MPKRNFSAQEMFNKMAKDCVQEFGWTAGKDFSTWKSEAYPKVMACLGDWPERVPANAELIAEWEVDGTIKQRWLIDVSKHASVAFIVARPSNMADGEKREAILCWHGHGDYGKDSVMGIATTPERRAEIASLNYDYGHQMAKAGFVTFAIDWMGMGERNEVRRPHFRNQAGGRDWCNLYYLHATMLGMSSIAINVLQGMAATDFACTLPWVSPDKLGVMGLSGGGTMALWSGLCDERLKAIEIICYSELWSEFGFHDINYCGMQVAPGLYKLVDLPDLQGLLAPRPLLVDIGIHDSGFCVDDALGCFKKVESIYQAAGVSDRLSLDLFPGEHGWGGNKSVEFFRQYL